jgi:Fur family ferric uptake transcriptional regulator
MTRNTRQRAAIRRVFVTAERPLTPQEVLSAAKAGAPRLGIATVYRTIKALAEQGEICMVELPGEPPRYELAGKAHHHFFHCSECGHAYVVDGCVGDFELITPEGFVLERHEIVLYGKCSKCADMG